MVAYQILVWVKRINITCWYLTHNVFLFQEAVAIPKRHPDAVVRDTTSLNQVRIYFEKVIKPPDF